MPNIGQHLCVQIYSHMKCKFWVYQDTETPGAWIVSWCIFIEKKTNQIRSRGLRIHWWPACLSLYLCGKLLFRNFATLRKIGSLDHFVWRRKWNSCLSQSVASSILPSHDGLSACNCLYCDKEGLCSWICLRTHLLLGCVWHPVLLHEDMPGFISKHNMGQGVIADRNIVYHFRKKYRTMNTIMWFNLLKNSWFVTMQLQMFPASMAVECWVPG